MLLYVHANFKNFKFNNLPFIIIIFKWTDWILQFENKFINLWYKA